MGFPIHSYASIIGVWSNPVLAGFLVDGLTNVPVFTSDNGNAVVTLSGGTITFGDAVDLQGLHDPVVCANLAAAGGSCFSSLTFTGASSIPAVIIISVLCRPCNASLNNTVHCRVSNISSGL